jgi:Ca2+-binding EF-hand superfamily protein
MKKIFADGEFSVEEAKKLHDEGFFKNEAKTFELDREQFASVLKVTGVQTEAPEAYFDFFDADGNGFVDWVEFCSGASFVMREGSAEEAKRGSSFLFHVLDTDGSGTIELSELKMHLTNQASMFFPMPEDQIARIVKQSTQELEKEDSDPIDYADFEYSLLRFDDFMRMAQHLHVFASPTDVVTHLGHVGVVQVGVHLVKDEEGRGRERVDREEQCQHRHGLLTTRQVLHVAKAFARRHR